MNQEECREEARQRVLEEARVKTGRLDLSSLKELDQLPEIESLGHLKKFDCSATKIADLAPLAKLSALQSVDCSATLVSDLSPLSALFTLESLDCGLTQVSDLTPLADLAALQFLNCWENRISDLSPLSGLFELQSLNCSATQVADLSPLKGLSELRELGFWETKVTDLSPLAGLNKLLALNFPYTEVSDIAPLADLVALQQLDCSFTQITDLTPLGCLVGLERLWANEVTLDDFPRELLDSNRLFQLELRGVGLEGVPDEILNQGCCLKALRSHYRDLDEGDELLPDVKVMVLGNGRIGKTQLCGQLRGDAYDREADSTHGVIVSSADLGEDRLHLWDFGGQELYHGTHSLFMKTRAVFVILWTPDSENQQEHEWNEMTFRNHRLDYWLELVAAQGGTESPVLIVQCQCDGPESELSVPPVEKELLERFRYKKVLHHSSATQRGMGALKESLTDAIRWMRGKQGEVRIGAGRLRVKRRLEALRDADALRPPEDRQHRLVSQEFFRQICEEEKGVSDAGALLSYLHQTGIVFYQKGLFGDQIILDQGWALEAIYTVFHREKCWQQIRREGGRFTRGLLEAFAWQATGWRSSGCSSA